MAIENDITPETPMELALVERINQLHRMMLRNGIDPNFAEYQMPVASKEIRLPIAAEIDLNTDHPAFPSLYIRAQTYGPNAFGYAHFIHQDQLQRLKRGDGIRMAGHINKVFMHKLAAFLMEKENG